MRIIEGKSRLRIVSILLSIIFVCMYLYLPEVTYAATLKSLRANVTQVSVNAGSNIRLVNYVAITAVYSDGKSQDVTYSCNYSMANSNIAKLPGNGTIVGVKAGSTTLIAKYGGQRVGVTVNVNDGSPVLQSLRANVSQVSVNAGSNIRLVNYVAITGVYSDGKSQDVTYSCDYSMADSNIAKLPGNGTIVGVNPGSTTLIAKYGGQRVGITVHVNNVDNTYGTWKSGSATLYWIKTTPDKIVILQNPNGNIKASPYGNCINGGFFGLGSSSYPRSVASISVTNNKPVYDGNVNTGGLGWGNTGRSGTLIYDKSTKTLRVAEITTAKEIADNSLVSDLNNYFAIGGISWNSYSKCPNPSSAIGRTAIVFDGQNNLYCIVTNKMSARDFYKAINENVSVVNGVHLDGSGSSQMKYDGKIITSGDGRKIPVVIGIQN